MVDISVVIVTFNSEKLIGQCLDSLFSQELSDFEIIIVDNGSKDRTIGCIKEKYGDIRLIENKHNLGISKARNQGVEVSTGRFILAIDCDTVLEKDFIFQVRQAMGASSNMLGAVQGKILNFDRKTIYSAGIHLSFLRRFYDIGRNKKDSFKFSQPRYVFGACSAATLYRREMLEDLKEETGYFDENIFFLVEDIDLSWRAQNKGWKILFFPQAVCYHAGNSSGTSRRIRQYLSFRNRYYMILKNEGVLKYVLRLIPLLFYDTPRLLCLIFLNPYIFNPKRLNRDLHESKKKGVEF
jgi:GT2 family glycosyltransferase